MVDEEKGTLKGQQSHSEIYQVSQSMSYRKAVMSREGSRSKNVEVILTQAGQNVQSFSSLPRAQNSQNPID